MSIPFQARLAPLLESNRNSYLLRSLYRRTRVDDSSSRDGLPSHRHIDTFGRRMVIRDTATGISGRRYRRDVQPHLVESHDIRQRVRASIRKSALRHTLRSCVLLRSSRCASESRLPRHLWHCFCLYVVPRARTKWHHAGATLRFPPEVGMKEVSIMKSLTFTEWYRILRAHHHWTVFQSIQYALWLAR